MSCSYFGQKTKFLGRLLKFLVSNFVSVLSYLSRLITFQNYLIYSLSPKGVLILTPAKENLNMF